MWAWSRVRLAVSNLPRLQTRTCTSKKSKKAEEELRRGVTFVKAKGQVGETVLGTNWMANGEDAKILPDSEYPEWVWKLADPKPTLDELDKKDRKYWKLLRRTKMMERKRQRQA